MTNQASVTKNILVVDDNRDVADALGKLVTILGGNVKVAYGGEEAIKTALEFHPDIIFMDLAMPGMDGYETAKKIKADARLAGAKLIALTGFGQEEYKERSREAGFDEYMVKPINMADLQKIIEEK